MRTEVILWIMRGINGERIMWRDFRHKDYWHDLWAYLQNSDQWILVRSSDYSVLRDYWYYVGGGGKPDADK